jgi:NAD-dependent deacetylase
MEPYKERINRAAELLKESNSITAFTGAGISTESGISDFRSKGGVWDRYRIVTYQEFIESHESRIEYWNMKKELYEEMKDAIPNEAHKALAELEMAGKLHCLITQNIDGLHQDAGSTGVIELHGTNRKAVCLDCGKLWPIEEVQERLKKGDIPPVCDECMGFIKPATVSFGQAMPEKDMMAAHNCALNCDLMLMIGSSLQVEPAASLPRNAHRAGAKLIYINRTATSTDHLAEVVFNENAGDVMCSILDMMRL